MMFILLFSLSAEIEESDTFSVRVLASSPFLSQSRNQFIFESASKQERYLK